MSKSSRPPVQNDLPIPIVRYVAPIVLTIAALLAIYLSVSLIFNTSGHPSDRIGDFVDLVAILWATVAVIIAVPLITGVRKPTETDPPIPSGGTEAGGG
jgi:hypothetical protein